MTSMARSGWRMPRAAVALLLAIGSAQMADGITFVRMVLDHGIAAEQNPLVAHLAASGTLAPLLVLKVLLVIEVVAIAAVVGRHFPVLGGLVATAAVVAGLVGAFSNVAVIAFAVPA